MIRLSPLHRRLAGAALVCLLLEQLAGRGAADPSPFSHAWIGFVIMAFSTVASWLGAAGGAIATALVTTVKWLSHGVGWLTSSLRKVISSTGGMFRRVWESARGLWSRVVRPFLIRVHDWINDLRAWLKRVAGPVFKFLNELRAKIREIYDKFVRPVLDTIAVIRGALQVLAKLHVPFAKALDQYLARLESAIVENYLKLTGVINRVINVIDSIVTFELLFQRVPFLRTLVRDAGYLNRIWWHVNLEAVKPATSPGEGSEEYLPRDPVQDASELKEFWLTRSGPRAPVIQELSAMLLAAAHGHSK